MKDQSRVYVISRVITAPPSSTAKYEICRVPVARNLVIHRILLHFPAGSNYTLSVTFFVGEEQILPDEGYFTGDDVLLEIPVAKTIPGNSTLYARITNSDDTYDHRIEIIIIGELVS